MHLCFFLCIWLRKRFNEEDDLPIYDGTICLSPDLHVECHYEVTFLLKGNVKMRRRQENI